MRRHTGELLAAVLLLLGGGARADEQADKVAEQKKAAEANWALIDAGEFAYHETAHLLVYAPKMMEKRLQGVGTALEKDYTLAKKALEFDASAEPWPGK